MIIRITRESAVNFLLLAYVALTPLLVIPVAGMLGASDLLFIPGLALALVIVRPSQFTSTHLMLAAFLTLVGVSLLQSREFDYVLKWARLIAIAFPFFLAAFATVSLQKVIRVFFWSGMLSILIGVVLFWFDIALFADEANQRIWTESGESRVRAGGLFGNSGSFGALLAMWAVTCGLAALSENKPNKLVLSAVLVTTLLGLVGSTSRASLVGILAGVSAGGCLMLVSQLRRRAELRVSIHTMALGAFLLATLFATLFLVLPQLMDPEWLRVTTSRFNPASHQSSNRFLSGRLLIWREYVQSADQWGFFGVGYKQGHLHFPTAPHNQLLSLAAESGIPCLCVFLLFLANVLGKAISQRRDLSVESMLCIAVLSTFLADGMGGEPLASWQITPITMLILGLCVSRFETREKPSPRDVASPGCRRDGVLSGAVRRSSLRENRSPIA